LCLALCVAGLWAQSPASLFVFPRFLAFEGVSTGVAIFNPSTKEATVQLYLVGTDGKLVSGIINPATVRVPPLGQIARTADQLFGSFTVLDGWLTISSSTPGLLAYYQTFDSYGTYIDGAESVQADMTLIFPVIPGSTEGASEIDLLNPNVRPTAVELKLWSFGGDLLGKATVQVLAGSLYTNLTSNIFPDGTSFSNASHITATSKPLNIFSQAQSFSGTSLFAGFSSTAPGGGGVDIAALNALTPTQTFNGGVIPHFRTGSKHASTLSVANVEPAAIDVTVTAVANNGSTLGTRKLNLKANGGYRAPLTSVFPSLGFAEQEGWILVQASGRVTAAVIYGRSDTGSLSAVPMQKTPKTAFIFPQMVQGSGRYTEISLANSSSNTSYADVYVVNAAGVTQASNQVVLGPGSRIAKPLNLLIPELTSQSGGYVYVSATEPLFATASIWTSTGATVSNFTPQSLTTYYAPALLTSFAVTGKVTLNDRPAAGFRVVLSGPVGKLATTAADGSYMFTGLPAGRYSMVIDQYGFQFIPAQTNFEITTASIRQDFQGFTASDAILIQPSTIPAGSADVTATVFGRDFNATSGAFIGSVRLKTTFIDSAQLQILLPAYLLSSPTRHDVFVVTNDIGPDRRVSQAYPVIVYQDRPTLTGVSTPGTIVEGSPGTTITLRGTGFLKGAKVKVNGSSDDIQVNILDAFQILAQVPPSYFVKGGIYPVTVENPFPANIESNIQLLTVFYPAPSVQEIIPSAVPARLEPGAGPLNLEVLGYGFRRGAVVYFKNEPLATTYCENDGYCLAVHLYAKVPASLLRSSGFADILVKNPSPSLDVSEKVFLRIDGLQPTITSVVPGSATALDLPSTFRMPVVVNGTNFGPQTRIRVYRVTVQTLPDPTVPDQVISTTQLYLSVTVDYQNAIGEWKVEVSNPQPGGGVSEAVSFFISQGTFVGNPFLISMSPEVVAVGGPAFSLTINGTNFKDGAQVQFYSTLLATTVVSDKQVRADVPASLIGTPGRIPICVINPDNGGTSNRLYLDIR